MWHTMVWLNRKRTRSSTAVQSRSTRQTVGGGAGVDPAVLVERHFPRAFWRVVFSSCCPFPSLTPLLQAHQFWCKARQRRTIGGVHFASRLYRPFLLVELEAGEGFPRFYPLLSEAFVPYNCPSFSVLFLRIYTEGWRQINDEQRVRQSLREEAYPRATGA